MKRRKSALDQLLVERGLAESREKARALILAGQVLVDGQKSDKPGTASPPMPQVELLERMPYVSRGGLKLAAALDHFSIDVTGSVCLDVGSSTGGFTDCLLQRGAARVWAIDVGTRPARLEAAQRSARGGARRRKRALSQRGGFSGKVRSRGLRRQLHFDHADDSGHRATACAGRRNGDPGETAIRSRPRGQVGKGGIVRDPELHRAACDRVRAPCRGVWASKRKSSKVRSSAPKATGSSSSMPAIRRRRHYRQAAQRSRGAHRAGTGRRGWPNAA